MLRVGREELGYVEKIMRDREERNKFWGEFASSCPTLFSCIKSVRNSFAMTHARQIQEETLLATAHMFMAHAACIFGALYAANGKKFPRVTEDKDQIVDMVVNCGAPDEIARQEKFLYDIGKDWIREFMAAAERNRFCMHGIAPIYALAEAFVKSAEAEGTAAPEATVALPTELKEREGKKDPALMRKIAERDRALWPSVKEFMESDA